MIPTPGNCSSFVTVSHCLNSAPLDVEMLIDNYRHTTVKMTMKTISVHLICQSKVAKNLFIRLHPTFFCRVTVCVPERFRISGNAWVSPTRPSSTLGNVYCKLAGRGWGRKSLQIPCCCRWMLIHNRGVWVCVRGVRSQTDGYGNLETGRPGQTGRVAKGKSGMERVRPFGGWAWKSQCWLSLYSPPPPSALSSSSPLPIHISCPFLRWRGWMGAPSHP